MLELPAESWELLRFVRACRGCGVELALRDIVQKSLAHLPSVTQQPAVGFPRTTHTIGCKLVLATPNISNTMSDILSAIS